MINPGPPNINWIRIPKYGAQAPAVWQSSQVILMQSTQLNKTQKYWSNKELMTILIQIDDIWINVITDN